MSTYLMREKYIFSSIFKEGVRCGEFESLPSSSVLLYLRSYMSAPFTFQHYCQEVLGWSTFDGSFESKYLENFEMWVERYLAKVNNQELIST